MRIREKITNWINRQIVKWKYEVKEDNAGMGTVEVILIIVVLVGIVIIFKTQITDLVESIFSKITKQANKV